MDRHNDGPDNELSHLPHQGSHIDLLPGEDEHHKDRSFVPHSRIRGFLRQFRLGFLAIVFGYCLNWRSNTEYRKVAIYHNRTVAATHSLLHLIPLGGAIALLVLQWTSYLASPTDDDSTTLQFVAKLHELFLQASIIEVMLYLIRTQVVDGFVPLGLLSGAVQATQLSYIWSIDYVSIFKSPAFRGWRRWSFALAIPVLILLISLLGPSSAILMIPRPDSPRVRERVTLYTSNSTEVLFPKHIGPADGFNLTVPRMNKTAIIPLEKQFIGERDSLLSYLSQDSSLSQNSSLDINNAPKDVYDRVLRMSVTETTVMPMDSTSHAFLMACWQALVSIPTAYGAASFYSAISVYSEEAAASTNVFNVTVTSEMFYPVVDTQCVSWRESDTKSNPEQEIPYIDDAGTLGTFSLADSVLREASESIGSNDSDTYYTPVWITSPQPGSNSLVGIFITSWGSANEPLKLPSTLSNFSQFDSGSVIRIVSCTLSAFWELGEVQLLQSSAGQVINTNSYPKSKSRHARSIELNIADVDPIRSARFHQQMGSKEFFGPDYSGADSYSLNLGTMFALEISKTTKVNSGNDYTSIFNGNHDKDLQMYPPPDSDLAKMNTFKFNFTFYGYGYGTRSTSVYLAMAVISTYCVIVLIYIIYTIITGSSSTAWNSGIELVTLALQSKKPDHIGYSSVGIDSIKTFGESVGIRVNADDELELVFAHDRDFEKRGLRKIERNKEY